MSAILIFVGGVAVGVIGTFVAACLAAGVWRAWP